MAGNVIQLTRPKASRPDTERLGMYLRVGSNQHKDMQDLLAEGETNYFGIIIEAQNTFRQKDLRLEASLKDLDVILDTKTHASATIGGHGKTLGKLPWGIEGRPHRTDDFKGDEGVIRGLQIAEFGHCNNFTQILGPTHLLMSPNDRWLRRDIEMMGNVRNALDKMNSSVQLIYPVAMPMKVFRDPHERQAIIAAISDAPFDAIWLKIDNFGTHETGDKTKAYIEGCNDFKKLGVPVVADHVGGLTGLGMLALGATGGIAHGITLNEAFRSYNWHKPRKKGKGGGLPTRVYIPQLDLLLKPQEAQAFLDAAPRIKSNFGCRDTHCCPSGVKDMIHRPARHFIHQRSEQVEEISKTPPSIRPQYYMDEHVRKVSDNIAAAVGLKSVSPEMKKKFEKDQKHMSRYRQAMAHLVENIGNSDIETPAVPLTRTARENKK